MNLNVKDFISENFQRFDTILYGLAIESMETKNAIGIDFYLKTVERHKRFKLFKQFKEEFNEIINGGDPLPSTMVYQGSIIHKPEKFSMCFVRGLSTFEAVVRQAEWRREIPTCGEDWLRSFLNNEEVGYIINKYNSLYLNYIESTSSLSAANPMSLSFLSMNESASVSENESS